MEKSNIIDFPKPFEFARYDTRGRLVGGKLLYYQRKMILLTILSGIFALISIFS